MKSENVRDQSDGLPNGGYLWSISVPRWNSGTGVGLSIIFIGMLVILLVTARGGFQPTILTVVVWFFLFVALAGLYHFTKWIIWPPIVLAAVNDGLIIFFRTDKHNYDPVGVMVPWAEITSLGYECFRQDVTRHTIVVHLGPNNSVPLDQIGVQSVKDSVSVSVCSKKIATKAVDDLTRFVPRKDQPH